MAKYDSQEMRAKKVKEAILFFFLSLFVWMCCGVMDSGSEYEIEVPSLNSSLVHYIHLHTGKGMKPSLLSQLWIKSRTGWATQS